MRTHLSAVHNTPEEFENGDFTLKTHHLFSVHATPEIFKSATITVHFGFVFRDAIVFAKLRFQTVFRPRENEKFEERFSKAPFSRRISVDGRPN